MAQIYFKGHKTFLRFSPLVLYLNYLYVLKHIGGFGQFNEKFDRKCAKQVDSKTSPLSITGIP
jgi:hypothetical protein